MPYKDPMKAALANKKWKKEHPELVSGQMKRYRKRYPERLNAYTKKWFKENPGYKQQWVKDHPVNVALSQKIYAQRMRSAVLELLGGKYMRCPFSDPRALQIDHVDGGGQQERRDRKHKGIGKKYYNIVIESVLKGEGKYQLLCANCNWIKRVENNEIPNGSKIQ